MSSRFIFTGLGGKRLLSCAGKHITPAHYSVIMPSISKDFYFKVNGNVYLSDILGLTFNVYVANITP